MIYAWDAIRSHIAARLSEVTGTRVEPTELSVSPDFNLGDIAFGCFKYAKQVGKAPAALAIDFAAALTLDHVIHSGSAAGPYLNIRLQAGELAARVVADIELMGEQYGASEVARGQSALVEYANPNTHKEIHVGHVRNLVLGASIVNLWKFAGWQVHAVSYVNDVGTHVAKCLWQFVRSVGVNPSSLTVDSSRELLKSLPLEKRRGEYLAKCYVDATRELEAHPEYEAEVSVVHNALERRDPVWDALWSETRRWSLDELTEVFQEIGVDIEHQYVDSQFVERAHDVARQLESKGIAEVSQGALIVNLEARKLGVMLIRKTDGALLYPAKDLALFEQKLKDYPLVSRLVVLVDFRQVPHFSQVYAVLGLMGFAQSFETFGYGLVTLPEGAMSSRKGTVITYATLKAALVEAAEFQTHSRHPEWTEGKITHTSWCIAIAGLKFGMLRVDAVKDIVFDLQKSVAFEGDTGPSVQYAAVRLQSILKKSGKTVESWRAGDLRRLEHASERALALQLGAWTVVAQRAAEESRPSLVVQYLLALVQVSNAFYRDVPILEAPEEVKLARLRLIDATREVFEIGLGLLGIPIPEEM